MTYPIKKLSNHAVPRAVESPVSEAGVVYRLDVVVKVDDMCEFLQQVRNVSDELTTVSVGHGRPVHGVAWIDHNVRLNLQT